MVEVHVSKNGHVEEGMDEEALAGDIRRVICKSVSTTAHAKCDV